MGDKRIWSILGNSQRLDGGAMFGNVPKAMWSQWVEPADDNRIPLACRAMLVEDDGRLILFETGVGSFFSPKLRARYGVQEDRHVLLDNLEAAGFSPDDIDVVVLSHLHFDHAGGLLSAYDKSTPPHLVFTEASFVVSWDAWQRAKDPHPRDRASFIAELPSLLEESGRLEVVKGGDSKTLGAGYRFVFSEGHTPGLMITEVTTGQGPVVYASDLIPGRPWVHLPITMGYDRYPELLVDEKASLLKRLAGDDGLVFFTHDHEVAAARVSMDDRGRFTTTETHAELTGNL